MNAYIFSSIQSAAYGNLFECSTHEADVEETLSQLSSIGYDGFYELDGEYYGWKRTLPPPYDDFDEVDLITAEVLAEKLVSNYE